MAQLVQSVYEAPVQVEQLAWHAEHVSAAVAGMSVTNILVGALGLECPIPYLGYFRRCLGE